MQTFRLICMAVLLASAVGQATSSGQTRTLEVVGVVPRVATMVHVHETHLYVADGPTLRIFDVADPAAPVLLGSYSFPQNVRDVDVSGRVAYAAVDFYGLGILDVADPSAPTLLATVEIPGQALSVSLAGSTVVVANRLSGLEVVDVSDPTAPVAKGSYFADGYAIQVETEGRFAYVADTPEGIVIVDTSASGEPDAESLQGTTEPPGALAVTRLPDTGATIAGVMSTSSLFELFDVSDPTAPAAVGTHRLRGSSPDRSMIAGAPGAAHVAIDGSLAFITSAFPPFVLEVLDLSDPAHPHVVASYEPPSAPRGLAAQGSTVFLAIPPARGQGAEASPQGVLILRIT